MLVALCNQHSEQNNRIHFVDLTTDYGKFSPIDGRWRMFRVEIYVSNFLEQKQHTRSNFYAIYTSSAQPRDNP